MWRVGGGSNNFFSEIQLDLVCELLKNELHMRRHHFFGPGPLGPWGGAKKSNIIISELQSQFSKIFKPNFVYLLTNERYITYQPGFLFGLLGHAQGRDFGLPWGVGGQILFLKFNQIWYVSYSHE